MVLFLIYIPRADNKTENTLLSPVTSPRGERLRIGARFQVGTNISLLHSQDGLRKPRLDTRGVKRPKRESGHSSSLQRLRWRRVLGLSRLPHVFLALYLIIHMKNFTITHNCK